MRRAPTKSHNYMPLLLKAAAILQAKGEVTPGINDITIKHDDWCDIYHNGYCNCEPLIGWKGKILEMG